VNGKTYRGVCRASVTVSLVASAFAASIAAQGPTPAVRGVETLRISGAEFDLSHVLWVVGFPDGRVAVGGPPKDGPVRWFDATGRLVGRFGRDGEGPGEFRLPSPAGRLGDTLWVIDGALNRITFLLPGAGSPARFTTMAMPIRIEAAANLTRPLLGSVEAVLPGRRLAFHGSEFDSTIRVPRAALRRLAMTDSGGRLLATVPPFETPGKCQVPYTAGKMTGFVGVYFCAQAMVRVAQDGNHIAIVTGDNSSATQSTITVRLYSPDARLLYERTLRVPAQVIPKQLADSIQRVGLTNARTPEARAARSRARIPPAYPPVFAVVISDAGAVWLGTPGGTTHRTWIVLDPKGMRQADVLLPRMFRPATVFRDQVIGMEQDADDFVDVVRYRVTGR